MANNCYNYIHVEGRKEEILKLKNKFSNNLLEKDKGRDGGMLDLVSLTNWKEGCDIYKLAGTKWFDVDIEQTDDETLIISGDTAWSPALELFVMLSKEFQALKITYDYEESGCDFGGWAEISNGEIEDNSYTFWEYKFKRDYSFACEIAVDEIKYLIEDGLESEIQSHSIARHISKKDLKEIVKDIKNKLKNIK